jgi:hypothetical protein
MVFFHQRDSIDGPLRALHPASPTPPPWAGFLPAVPAPVLAATAALSRYAAFKHALGGGGGGGGNDEGRFHDDHDGDDDYDDANTGAPRGLAHGHTIPPPPPPTTTETLADWRTVRYSNQKRAQMRTRAGKSGATSYHLRQYAEATLGGGSLRKVVKLPEGEDENEWLAVNSEWGGKERPLSASAASAAASLTANSRAPR